MITFFGEMVKRGRFTQSQDLRILFTDLRKFSFHLSIHYPLSYDVRNIPENIDDFLAPQGYFMWPSTPTDTDIAMDIILKNHSLLEGELFSNDIKKHGPNPIVVWGVNNFSNKKVTVTPVEKCLEPPEIKKFIKN